MPDHVEERLVPLFEAERILAFDRQNAGQAPVGEQRNRQLALRVWQARQWDFCGGSVCAMTLRRASNRAPVVERGRDVGDADGLLGLVHRAKQAVPDLHFRADPSFTVTATR